MSAHDSSKVRSSWKTVANVLFATFTPMILLIGFQNCGPQLVGEADSASTGASRLRSMCNGVQCNNIPSVIGNNTLPSVIGNPYTTPGGTGTTVPTGTPTVTAPAPLSKGYYNIGPTILYADENKHYCAFDAWEKYTAHRGSKDLDQHTGITQVPSVMINDGICQGPSNLTEGFHSLSGQMLYANSLGHYCTLSSWENYTAIRHGTNINDYKKITSIPNTMIKDGTCQDTQVNLKTGYYSFGTGIILANNEGHYCAFDSWEKYTASRKGVDLDKHTHLDAIPSSMVSDGVCQGPVNLKEGFFHNAGTISYANNLGHYCSFDSWDKYVATRDGQNLSSYYEVSAIPSTMVYDGVCQGTPNLQSGYYAVGTGIIYANSEGHYCAFDTWEKYTANRGGANLDQYKSINSIPSSMINDGICQGPVNLSEGFYHNNHTIYYANAFGHYCGFDSWEKYTASRGGVNVDRFTDIAAIPSTMKYDGICQGPVNLKAGLYQYGDKYLLADQNGSYCYFSSTIAYNQYRASLTNYVDATPIPSIPSSMVSSGICPVSGGYNGGDSGGGGGDGGSGGSIQ